MRIWAIGLALVVALPAFAQAPASSERPVARGGNPVVQPVQIAPSGAIEQPEHTTVQEEKRARGGLFSPLRPLFRSGKVEKKHARSVSCWPRGLCVVMSPFKVRLWAAYRGAFGGAELRTRSKCGRLQASV